MAHLRFLRKLKDFKCALWSEKYGSLLTSVTAHHLPLFQCIAIAFRILILCVNFIVPLVVQRYFAHWLTILSIAQPILWWDYSVVLCLALLETSEAIYIVQIELWYCKTTVLVVKHQQNTIWKTRLHSW